METIIIFFKYRRQVYMFFMTYNLKELKFVDDLKMNF